MGTATQPIELAFTATASQTTDLPTFESLLRESQIEAAIVAPTEGSKAATVAALEDDHQSSDQDPFDERFVDNFEGIDWARLSQFMKPLATQKQRKSWVFRYGYRVTLRKAPTSRWFAWKYCHEHKIIDAGGAGLFNVTKATSSAAAHLGLNQRGHNLTRDGLESLRALTSGQISLRQAFELGVEMPQGAANAIGNFNVQGFRLAAVLWLVDNNYPLRKFTTPAFRAMITFANSEAEVALWASHTSISTFAMRLFGFMQPHVIEAFSTAISKVHISFDGWTTKGGKRGFFGDVAHFLDAAGVIRDLPIDLPQLAGAHTSKRIAEIINSTLPTYHITPLKLSDFILDNSTSNDTAVTALARHNGFIPSHRRLRCGPHTLNLVGQAIMFGKDRAAYENEVEKHKDEEEFMDEWRRDGSLGVLIDVIN
ncbi:hat domain-containing protein [Stemphylium lycopersici]|nr:hat domain-containing protein [Stemphylium lycopersici]